MGKQLHVLLADDDNDDRFFFDQVLKSLPISTKLTMVDNGEKLLDYLGKNSKHPPDVVFLDLNMPRKNGLECVEDISYSNELKKVPIVIYSTSLHEDVASLLYEKGADYYIRKTDVLELKKALAFILNLLDQKKFERPPKDKFILGLIEA